MGGTSEDLVDFYGELGQKEGTKQSLPASVMGADMLKEPQGLPITQASEGEEVPVLGLCPADSLDEGCLEGKVMVIS